MFFASPHRLFWLLLLVPMLGAAVGYLYWRSRVHREIGEPELIDAMTESRSPVRQWLRIGLVGAAVTLLVFAAAEPKWGRTAETVEQEGVDIVYALDLSKSMLARDVAPTRLEAATGEMEQTLARLDGDRVGLVVYTTVSFVQSPLTTDYGALEFYLEKLDPSQMSVGGTAIGEALRDSVELLTGRPVGAGDSRASRNAKMDRAATQVIVLMSDGEDHETRPVRAAERARKRGIRVVTVGVGTEAGAKIPVRGEGGEIRGYKRTRAGELVKTSLEEKQLREIAEAGGGTYIRYQGDGSVANELSRFVDRLEATRLESERMERYRDRYLWFVIPALFALLASFLIGERRSGGATASSVSAGGLVLVAAALVAATGCTESFRATQPAVRKGNDHVESEEWSEALEAYERAADQLDPVPPVLHYNRGRAQLGREKYEEARAAFGRALGSDDPSVRFDAHFGIGVSFSEREKWSRAVDAYERALGVYQTAPGAIGDDALADARHNLELAYRKLYPPCRNEEDDLEENDRPKAATALDKSKKEGLTLCGLDDDWYAVRAPSGATVSVAATFRTLGEEDDPDHEFLPSPEDLRLELYGSKGEKRLARDRGSGSSEPPEGGPVERRLESIAVGEAAGSNSRVLVRLSAADKLKFEYDLTVNVQPPCRELEESSEPNDSRADARALKPGHHQMQMCGADSDWFRVQVKRGNSVFVDVRPNRREKSSDAPAKADELTLEALDAASGEPVADARRDGPYWTAGLQESRRDRTIEFRVGATDGDVETPYRVDVYRYEPCMAGDDRYEPNDARRDAKRLSKRSRHHRYLRLCPRDEDFYEHVPRKRRRRGKQRGAGPRSPRPLRLGLQKLPRSDALDPEVEFSALDAKSGETISEGESPRDDGSEGDSEEARFDQVLTAERDERGAAIPVRVFGETTFYHLVELPSGGGRNQRKKNNERENQKKRREKSKNRESRDERGDENSRKRRDEQREPSRRKRRKQESADRREQNEERDQERRAQDILEALERSDKNFQMQKALEKNRQKGSVDKDW